jgi:hypothetical protein
MLQVGKLRAEKLTPGSEPEVYRASARRLLSFCSGWWLSLNFTLGRAIRETQASTTLRIEFCTSSPPSVATMQTLRRDPGIDVASYAHE